MCEFPGVETEVQTMSAPARSFVSTERRRSERRCGVARERRRQVLVEPELELAPGSKFEVAVQRVGTVLRWQHRVRKNLAQTI